jgi:predicted nucleotidyltransferase
MKPSLSLKMHLNEVRRILERRGMRNPSLFGSTARGEDTGRSDVDILVEAPPGTSLFDLADTELELEKLLDCKVEVMTRGFLAPDVAERVEADLIPLS